MFGFNCVIFTLLWGLDTILFWCLFVCSTYIKIIVNTIATVGRKWLVKMPQEKFETWLLECQNDDTEQNLLIQTLNKHIDTIQSASSKTQWNLSLVVINYCCLFDDKIKYIWNIRFYLNVALYILWAVKVRIIARLWLHFLL